MSTGPRVGTLWCVACATTAVLAAAPQHGVDAHRADGRRKLSLAHVENVSSPAVSGVLRWWCSTQGHAGEPLCARHEISLRISVARGSERLELIQRKQRLLGQSVQRELQDTIDSYCNSTYWAGAGANTPLICNEPSGGQTVPLSKA